MLLQMFFGTEGVCWTLAVPIVWGWHVTFAGVVPLGSAAAVVRSAVHMLSAVLYWSSSSGAHLHAHLIMLLSRHVCDLPH